MHYRVVKDAIGKGKHVLAEKPHTISLEQSLSLVKIAKQTNLVCSINYRYRYYPAIQELRKYVLSGKLGTVYFIQGTFFQDWLSNEKDFNWRLLPEASGKSATLTDIGSHVLDLIQYITGQRINRLFAHLKTIIPFRQNKINSESNIHINLDDYSNIIFETEKGITGSIIVSQVATGSGMSNLSIEIIGSKKTITWHREKPEFLFYKYRDKNNEVICFDDNKNLSWEHGIIKLMEAFYWDVLAHIKGREHEKCYSYPSFEDGYRSMKLLDAALESHRTETWVKVEYN